jgi:16S rRNA (uracil1498-N3)-methyltransferase
MLLEHPAAPRTAAPAAPPRLEPVPRFFVAAEQVAGGRARIEGEDAAHLARSLRAAPGERVVVADDAGMEHGVRLEAISARGVEGVVEWSRPLTGEPGLEVHVVQALAKDGMDELVEALAEVGAASIRPVLTQRTVPRPDARRAAHRVERWRAIARKAAGLAGRGRPPHVHDVHGLREAVAALPAGTRVLVCSVDATMALADVRDAGERIAVVIGPEGGLTAEEVAALQGAGARAVHMGPRVLRARLAGVVAVSMLLSASGDMAQAAAPAREAWAAAP